MSHGGTGLWVFGYGSLVDPSSFSATIGREMQPGVDFFEAEVAGLGRRWNYGVLHTSASGPGPSGAMIDYTLVALGVVSAAEETVNGVVGWVARLGGRLRSPKGSDRAFRTGSRCRTGGHRAAVLGPGRSRLRGVRPGGARPLPQQHAGARCSGDDAQSCLRRKSP